MLPPNELFRVRRRAFMILNLFLCAAFLPTCLADFLETRSTTVPAPIVFAPDQNWDGIDGQWSSFTLRVGTPQQFVRVFLSTASQQTWVVQPAGCGTNASSNDFKACNSNRGWLFNISDSSTWDPIGRYALHIEANLGYAVAIGADYGYDTVGLGGLGEGGPTLKNTTVGALVTTDFYLGIFGVHPKPTNFTSFNDPSPSYMTLLKENSLIPSLSYGYTAGNQYSLSGILASLTLGGYDTSRFTPNGMSFTFAPDNERDLVVGLQSITANSASKENVQLLPTPILEYIDSTVSEIWLPADACKAFEDAFGIEYNEVTSLYLVNDTLHSKLIADNANITFTIGATTSGGDTIDIVLPYAAFDLTAKPPYRGLESESRFFPLRRAANESQYTIGRTFLQEAYIIVDHERQNFSVSQCVFEDGLAEHIVAISSIDSNSTSNGTLSDSGSNSSSSLSTGAIVGIAVGIGVAAGLVAFGIFWWLLVRRRRRRQVEKAAKDAAEKQEVEPPSTAAMDQPREQPSQVIPKVELDATPAPRQEMPNNPDFDGYLKIDLAGDVPQTPSTPLTPGVNTGLLSEAETNVIHEMPGDMPDRQEADGRQLSEKETILRREQLYNGSDPVSPVSTQSPVESTRRAPVSASDVREVIDRTPISPLTEGSASPFGILSPLAALEGNSTSDSGTSRMTPSPLRRKFSFEE